MFLKIELKVSTGLKPNLPDPHFLKQAETRNVDLVIRVPTQPKVLNSKSGHFSDKYDLFSGKVFLAIIYWFNGDVIH